MSRFEILWKDAGREPQVAPDPAYPTGKDVDCSGGGESCMTPLPYPAKRIGSWIVRCLSCGYSVAVTTAGRADDPRSLRMPCHGRDARPGTPFVIGAEQIAQLETLRQRALAAPVEIRTLTKRLHTKEGKRKHMKQMSEQTVILPVAFPVTFSIEIGHPAGTARHLSMSVAREGRLPHPAAVWMVAEALGFVGGLESCSVWLEDLEGHGQAVNVAQPILAEGSRA